MNGKCFLQQLLSKGEYCGIAFLISAINISLEVLV